MLQLHQSQYILITTLVLSLPLIFLLAPRFLPPGQLPVSRSDELDDLSLFNRAILSSSPTLHSKPTSLAFSRLGSRNPNLKIAFLFLTNSDLHFAPLWNKFFNATSHKYYNIYIHADPTTPISDPGGVFSGRFVPAKRTQRSSATLISAARRLMANAIIDDPLNFYFALISQSCIPLHSFGYMYRSLFASTAPFGRSVRYKSYIEILANETTLPARYDARGQHVMMPEVPFERFRVGSQFWVMTKKHALMVLKERRLWRKFRLPCINVHSCYPEEHYFPTYLDMEDPDGCTRFTLTRVNWTESVDGHPHTYEPPEVSAELVYSLRRSNFSTDYLFARKFAPECLEGLMEMADDVIFKD